MKNNSNKVINESLNEESLNNEELQRSADFSGETPRYPMDGNSNCTAWCRWETYRVYRDGQPGWDCRFIINATKTNPYATYGYGKVQAGTHGHEEGTLEEKYMEIVANQVRTFYDQTVFVKAEAGADITLSAYANIIIPNVVSKGMKFTISVKRNLWGVYFDANGGTNAPSMQKKYFNNTLYLTTQKPTRSGYAFKGWATSSTSSYAQYQPGDAFTIDADTTLYAVWGQNVTKTWSITYNANGGYNAPAKQTANVGQSITITYSKPTRSGYTFLGWSTWSGATEPDSAYTPGYSYMSEYDTTLYAVWRQNQTTQYSLSFNLQGGTGAFNTLYGGYGERVQIPYTTPTKSGYTFKGWATYSGGSVSYQPGEYYTLYGNSTLYAVWQSSGGTTQYYLNFNLQGGSGTFNTLYGVYGERLFIPSSSPTKNGYTFQGWSTSSTGSPQYQPGDYYTIYSNTILYAIWSESTQYCTITFNANGGSGAPSSQQKIIGETTYIPYTKPTRSGYTFLGWSTSRYATSADYQPGSTYTPYGNMTFYAVWKQEEDRYTISFDLQGGSGEFNPLKGKYGEAWHLPSYSPVKDGYVFKGWATSPDGNPEYQPDDVYTIYGNATLYAVWEKKSTDLPSVFFPDMCSINLDFNYVPSINIRAEITNPQKKTIYYKVCFVDNSNGDVRDYFLNSNGNTGTISASTMNIQMIATSDVVKRSIQNCNNEFEFKIAICLSYDNIFSNLSETMKKYIMTISINNYRKPVIKNLTVERTPEGGAQLDAIFKYADSFTKVNINYTGATVYMNGNPAPSSIFTSENFLTEGVNTINSVFTFVDSAISDGNQTFKLKVSDGIFKVEQTVTLSILQSDGNIYIYPNGLIEASGFLKLSPSDENVILFKRGGFVYAKSFKKIANGVYFCPDAIELFGYGTTTVDHVTNGR